MSKKKKKKIQREKTNSWPFLLLPTLGMNLLDDHLDPNMPEWNLLRINMKSNKNECDIKLCRMGRSKGEEGSVLQDIILTTPYNTNIFLLLSIYLLL